MRRNRRKHDLGAAADGSTLAVARAFYCDALGGRQIRHMRGGNDGTKLRFLVGGGLVTTGPSVTDDRVTLVVDDALAIAERCWDAGFEVRVREVADAESIVVIDPFDLELEVISNGSQRPPRAAAIDEG